MLAVIAYPKIDPILVQFGPFAIRWYGLAYVAGFVAAGLVIARLRRRWVVPLTNEDLLDVLLAAVVGVVVGARLGYVLFYGLSGYLARPIEILRIWDGGMSFHGGLIGVVVAGLIVARRKHIAFLRLADMAAVGTPVGLFFGRLANFINGELWGRVSYAPWAMVFPNGGSLPRHPSQLYEAGLEGIVLLVVMLLLARKRRPDGEQLGWFLTLYGVFRIGVEFFREPDVQLGFILPGVTMGQILSVPVLILGVALVIRARANKRRADRNPSIAPDLLDD